MVVHILEQLIASNVWVNRPRILTILLRVYVALVTTGVDVTNLNENFSDFWAETIGERVGQIVHPVVTYAVLQMMVDLALFDQNPWIVQFIEGELRRLSTEEAPGRNNFRGSGEYWSAVLSVSNNFKSESISIAANYYVAS
jgi:hypothetical protein